MSGANNLFLCLASLTPTNTCVVDTCHRDQRHHTDVTRAALFDSTSLPAILKESGTVRQGCPPSSSLGQRHPLLVCSLTAFFYPFTLLRSLHYGDSSYTTPLTNIFVAVPVPSMQLNSTTPAKAQISILPSLHSTPPIHHPYSSSSSFSEPGGVCPCQLVVAYHLIRQMLPTYP